MRRRPFQGPGCERDRFGVGFTGDVFVCSLFLSVCCLCFIHFVMFYCFVSCTLFVVIGLTGNALEETAARLGPRSLSQRLFLSPRVDPFAYVACLC